MKLYSFEQWLVAAAILAFLVAIHWLAFRIGGLRMRRRRPEPRPVPPADSRPRPGGFDEPIPVFSRTETFH